MKLTIGCDPDSKSPAFAVYHNEKFVKVVQIKTDDGYQAVRKFLTAEINAQRYWDYTPVFAIESTYVNKDKQNVRGKATLDEAIGKLKMRAEDDGFEIIYFMNSEWYSAVFRSTSQARDLQKQNSLFLATKMFPNAGITNHNLADAVHIGGYASRRY